MTGRLRQVGLAAPFVLRQDERFLEKVLFAAYVLGYGVRTCASTTEPGPIFGAQTSAVVVAVWIRACERGKSESLLSSQFMWICF